MADWQLEPRSNMGGGAEGDCVFKIPKRYSPRRKEIPQDELTEVNRQERLGVWRLRSGMGRCLRGCCLLAELASRHSRCMPALYRVESQFLNGPYRIFVKIILKLILVKHQHSS